MHAGTSRGQERVSYPLGLELQELVNCPMWVLGTEFGAHRKNGKC